MSMKEDVASGREWECCTAHVFVAASALTYELIHTRAIYHQRSEMFACMSKIRERSTLFKFPDAVPPKQSSNIYIYIRFARVLFCFDGTKSCLLAPPEDYRLLII